MFFRFQVIRHYLEGIADRDRDSIAQIVSWIGGGDASGFARRIGPISA